MSLAREKMLVDDGPRQQIEAGGHPRLGLAAGDHHLGLNRRAGTGSADDSAAGNRGQNFSFDRRSQVGFRDLRLIAAAEPDASRLLERLDERVFVGFLLRPRVQHMDFCRTARFPKVGQLCRPLGIGDHLVRGIARRGNDHDPRLFASGQLDELLVHRVRLLAAADNHQRSA